MTSNPWSAVLLGSGPEPVGFRTITAALADLTMLDEQQGPRRFERFLRAA